ncbi:MAG TPA: hypothetical protein DIV40_05845 [Clostridiales bacterium]|jgi:hypothetical protein|nr:hypothetical protein [Clostridiales bacterium]
MKPSINVRVKHICYTAILYTVTYLIFRYVFWVSGILPIYTPGWAGSNILWIIAVISMFPILFGWLKFPYIAFAGLLLGNVAGELFGGFHSDIPPRYLHYGWFICIVVVIVSFVIGVHIERRTKKYSK